MPPTQRNLVEEVEEEADEEDDVDEEEEEWLPEERTVKMTVYGKDVSMRMSDCWLNATQIQGVGWRLL